MVRPIRILALCALVALGGCRWGNERPATDPADDAETRSLRATVERLEARARSLELDLARAHAEIERRDARIAQLEDDVASLRSDLETAERQFVTIERGLLRDETRASAVTAIAEARLRLDRALAADSSSVDSTSVERVHDLLATAGRLVERGNYAAAVYYARRAAREVDRARAHHAEPLAGDVAVVAAQRANLRGGPSRSAPRVAVLRFGAPVARLATRGDWVHVRTRDGREGWIHADLLH